MILKRVLSVLLSISLVTGCFLCVEPESVGAGVRNNRTTHYNLNDYEPFASRTIESIVAEYDSLDYLDAESNYYQVAPSFNAPYNAGLLNRNALQNLTDLINFKRSLCGISPVELCSTSNIRQCGAYLANYHFSHHINTALLPSDLPDTIVLPGLEGANTSGLIGGSLYNLAVGFLSEGDYDWSTHRFDTIGHRNIIMAPSVSRIDVGAAGSVSSAKAVEYNNSMPANLPFYSYPGAGYLPADTLCGAWQLVLNDNYLNVNRGDDVVVRITLPDGSVTTYSNELGGIEVSEQHVLIASPFEGLQAFEDVDYGGTLEYHIEVEGLKNTEGNPASVEWTIVAFRMEEYQQLSLNNVHVDYDSMTFASDITSDEKELFSFLLPDVSTMRVYGGDYFNVNLENSWSYNENDNSYHYTGEVNLPANVDDDNGELRWLNVPVNRDSIDPIYGYSYFYDTNGGLVHGNNVPRPGYKMELNYITQFDGNRDYDINIYHMVNGNLQLVAGKDNVDHIYNSYGYQNVFTYTDDNLTNQDSGYYFAVIQLFPDDNTGLSSEIIIGKSEYVQIASSTATSGPTPTPRVTSVPTGDSTNTPVPTRRPGATSTPAPTRRPGDTATPTPAPTGAQDTNSEQGVGGFVERLYTVALERESDPNGKADWINRVRTEGYTGADVARGFLFSPEFLEKNMSDSDFLDILYRVFFDREADEGGKNNWLAILASGSSKQDVINGFIGSVEWANVCLRFGIVSGGNAQPDITITPSADVIDFATRLYSTCLGREPDPDGLMDWATQIANMRISGSVAAHGFFFSSEFISADISDSEYVMRLYRTFMGREYDQGGYDNWMNVLTSGGTREDVFNGFAGSQEWAEICASYGILK